MTNLTEPQRQEVTDKFMQDRSAVREVLAVVTGANLKAAIDATDDWIESNQASFNSALPTAARNNLTLSQKTLLFCFVALKRAGL